MKICKTLGINLIVLLGVATLSSAQTWTAIPGYPGNGAGPCLLQTNGTVLCNNSQSNTNLWYRLTPDAQGHYATGTWTSIPNMPYQPIFFASATLPDGKMIVQGGEYLNGNPTWTNQGAVYDPVANAWTSVTCNVIPSGSLGDSQSVIFPDGTFMIANITNTQTAYITPANLAHITDAGTGCAALNNCYVLRNTTGKTTGDRNDEEGWTLLPSGDIITAEAKQAPQTQTYNFGTGAWTNSGTTAPCSLEDKSGSEEVGPLVLRPGDAHNANMTVIGFGAGTNSGYTGGCTAIYDTVAGTWSQGPVFPSGLDASDAPASLLPNGNVLVMVSPGLFNNGAKFFEWDGAALNPVPCVPQCANDSSFVGHMVILPEAGQVMFTDYSTDVEMYTTSGTYNPAWQPVITGIPFLVHNPGLYINHVGYEIDGLQFNGLAQGAQYGDDLQTATNWPLVRVTQVSPPNNVYYLKTHNHSTMAVSTGTMPVSTLFDVPATIPTGLYNLQVVANGIPSVGKIVAICKPGNHAVANVCT